MQIVSCFPGKNKKNIENMLCNNILPRVLNVKYFSYVIGLDIDEDALDVCKTNIEEFEMDNIDLVQQDIKTLVAEIGRLKVDTVVMNPPFGTKHNKGTFSQ